MKAIEKLVQVLAELIIYTYVYIYTYVHPSFYWGRGGAGGGGVNLLPNFKRKGGGDL